MNFDLTNQTLQILAWILAMISSSLALYILAMNWKHPTHQVVSLFLLVIATLLAAEGTLYGLEDVMGAFLPLFVAAITSLMVMPMMGVVTLRLLKSDWLKDRKKPAVISQWIGVTLTVLPVIIVLIDVFSGTWLERGDKLYFSWLDPASNQSGFIYFSRYTTGFASPILKTINILLPFTIILIFCLYIAIYDKKTSRAIKILAWILFLTVGISGVVQITYQFLVPEKEIIVWVVSLFALLFGFAFFYQMAAEHRKQYGNLQVRLTMLVLAIIAPLILTNILLVSSRTNLAIVILIGLGLVIFTGIIRLTVRQSLNPVQKLTETASSVSEGNLSIQAPVESEDELGYLAEKFNRMTWQLRETLSSLEDRVTERTADLERRSNQLKAAALVSKEAAGIRDIHQMMNQTVQLISNYFGFYHAGIFILDDVREYAVLEAANSEGGQRMLARGHKLRIGQVGIVGYVADVGIPRIALDVGEDAIFFNNPDLPLTRSEMALPLKARSQVIGVLDVQSIEEAAFTNEDVETLQVLADQVALALDNARLIKESRDALDELRTLYGQRTRQVWKERLERGILTYQYSRTGLFSGTNLSSKENLVEIEGIRELKEPVIRSNQKHEMLVPIILQGQVLGSLVLNREIDQKPWTTSDMKMARDLIAQVLPALENARLLEEIQNRAQTETWVGQISSRVQSSLDLETVLKTAVQEIGLVVNASRVQIRMADKAVNEISESAGDE